MFEDLEGWLKSHRGSRGSSDDDSMMPREILDDLAKTLAKEIGGHVDVLPGGKGLAVSTGRFGSPEMPKAKIDGLVNSLLLMGKALKLKPFCVDAIGNELKVGNVLKVPGGQSKTVLEVGYGFCILSRTDDHAKNDGAWFETEFKKNNFVK